MNNEQRPDEKMTAIEELWADGLPSVRDHVEVMMEETEAARLGSPKPPGRLRRILCFFGYHRPVAIAREARYLTPFDGDYRYDFCTYICQTCGTVLFGREEPNEENSNDL